MAIAVVDVMVSTLRTLSGSLEDMPGFQARQPYLNIFLASMALGGITGLPLAGIPGFVSGLILGPIVVGLLLLLVMSLTWAGTNLAGYLKKLKRS